MIQLRMIYRMFYKSQKIEYMLHYWNNEVNVYACDLALSKKKDDKEMYKKLLKF